MTGAVTLSQQTAVEKEERLGGSSGAPQHLARGERDSFDAAVRVHQIGLPMARVDDHAGPQLKHRGCSPWPIEQHRKRRQQSH